MSVNDPAAVRDQYATESNLQARQRLWEDAEGPDPKQILWQTLAAWKPQRVLEVGGGQGELAERIANELQASVTFLDLSPRMVELARERGLDAREGDVQELPFADESFDTVVAAWMLYHVPDIARGLSEIARVLVPGGALIAVTTSADHVAELRALLNYDIGLARTFTRENGEEQLRRHFATVERYDADVRVSVSDRLKLVDYQQSISTKTAPVPDDVELPFIVRGLTSIFFATK